MSIQHHEIIDLWPSTSELAKDLGVNGWRVQKWRTRNKIPSSFWVELIAAGKKRGLIVSLEALAVAKTKAA